MPRRVLRDRSTGYDRTEHSTTLFAVDSAGRQPATKAGEFHQPELGIELLATAEVERQRRWESVLLLGSPAVISAGREWHTSVWKVERYARGIAEELGKFEEDVKATNRARETFYSIARADLGVNADIPIPQPIEWAQPWRLRRMHHSKDLLKDVG